MWQKWFSIATHETTIYRMFRIFCGIFTCLYQSILEKKKNENKYETVWKKYATLPQMRQRGIPAERIHSTRQSAHRWAWQRSAKILLLLPCFPFCVNRRARGRMPPQQALGALCKVTNFIQDNPLLRRFWGKSVHKWADLFSSFFQLYFNRFCCYIDIFYTKWYNFYRISHKFSPTVEV